MSEARAVNIRREKADIYIGRGSKWGNPFRIKDYSSKAERDKVCDQYEEYLMGKPELLADIWELDGKTLGCYCKPLRCHGDLLAELANDLTGSSE
jgi:hypothetical protein